MAGLAFRRVAEQAGDIRLALNVGLLGKIQITAVCLGLPGKGVFKIIVRLRTLQFGHCILLFSNS